MGQFEYPITINDALVNISKNNYLLPAFQRDFKWEAEDIELLFDSIMQGFPISSMLYWKIDSSIINNIKFYYFNDEFIENPERVTNSPCIQRQCKQVNNNQDFFAVLDGQQRLTALRVALYGKYYSHIKNKEWDYQKNNTFEEKVLWLNLSKKGGMDDEFQYIFKYLNEMDEKNNLIEPIFRDKDNCAWYKLNDLAKYHNQKIQGINVTRYYSKYNLEIEEEKILEQLYDKIYTKSLINYYKEDTTNVDTAVKIFTRINNGGKALPLEEIIYSNLKSNWTKLDARKEIEDLMASIKNTGFNIGIAYVIKAFLVLYSSDVKYQLKTFNTTFCSLIENNWRSIKTAILDVFEMLNDFGMSNENLTAPNATLIMLYYIYHKNLKNFAKSVNYKTDRDNMKKWLYSVLLRKVFGGQGDNVLSQARSAFYPDFSNKKYIKNVNCAFDKDIINKNINKITQQSQATVVEELLNTQKDNSLAFLILSLLYPNLDYQNGDFHKDHMHPFSMCQNQKLNVEEYNSIINLQLLNSNDNQSKSKKSLDDWVQVEIANKPQNWINDFYDSHIIPTKISLDISNFQQFYDERKKLLINKLNQLI